MNKIFFFIFLSITILAHDAFSKTPDLIDKIKHATVSIDNRTSYSSFLSLGHTTGTGFLVNRSKGIILTNKHVISEASSATYLITFFNGIEIPANLLYHDPWLDFAFLKVDPQNIPENISELELDSTQMKLGQKINILGKNEGQDFSFHEGSISNLYESNGYLPNQSIRISLNIKGGASGSPVTDSDGKVRAIIYGGGGSFALALHIAYIEKALDQILQNKSPRRKHTGILVDYISLNHASTFYNFPEKEITEYINKYPDSFNRALEIKVILKESPASKSNLQVGDIIWKVNGNKIGPSILEMDQLVDQSEDYVIYSVFRDGKLITIKSKLYDLEQNTIKRFVLFAGAIFYESDDTINRLVSSGNKKLFITNISAGSSFYHIFPSVSSFPEYINIEELGGIKVKNLDDLIRQIPILIKERNFAVKYRNYGMFFTYNSSPVISRDQRVANIRYNSLDSSPAVFQFDRKKLSWISNKINY